MPRPPEKRLRAEPEDRTARVVLLLVTVALAGLVVLASPVGEALIERLRPPSEPLSAASPPPCPSGWLGEHWWRPIGRGRLGDGLAGWVHAARTQTPDPDRAARLRQAALRRTSGVALATLATTFELRAAPRLAPPPAEVPVRLTAVRYCPGERRLWELHWVEGEAREPWRAVVEVQGAPDRFLITDFDWGPVPATPGAAPLHPLPEERMR